MNPEIISTLVSYSPVRRTWNRPYRQISRRLGPPTRKVVVVVVVVVVVIVVVFVVVMYLLSSGLFSLLCSFSASSLAF